MFLEPMILGDLVGRYQLSALASEIWIQFHAENCSRKKILPEIFGA